MHLIRRNDKMQLMSSGKILEITPLIIDNIGVPYALPPVRYQVPNWLLGYQDEHVSNMPYTMMSYERQTIPGSSSNAQAMVSFMIRVYEDNTDMGRELPEVTAENVQALLKALKDLKENI